MEITVAKTAGFCFGVQRAVDTVYDEIARAQGPVYTYGPIVHNDSVVNDLRNRGVAVLNGPEDLEKLESGTVIIRAHGVGRTEYDLLQNKGIRIVDATCPFVKKIHRLVQEEQKKGRRVIIVGDPDHPEVQGIRGWGNENTLILRDENGIDELSLQNTEPLSIVAQTTYNYNKFQESVEKFNEKGYDINVLNTICNATQERQIEAKRIASRVDAMIVIGGRHSSNSRKLYEICQKECKNTYFIQTLGDFNPECVNSVRSVGITAGASTPKQIIEEVHTNVRIKF